MPKYLFSNDQRISALAERIQWVATYVSSGKKLKDIPGKSDNNNAATLEFYYNLYPDTKNTEIAVTSPQEVIRNFVLKFQFPNTRTPESFNDSITEGVYLAPFRMVVSILMSLAKMSKTNTAYLSLEEILYYVFTDSDVCKNPSVDCDKLAASIVSDRKGRKDFSTVVSANLEWKHYDRQVREMMAVLCKCSECFLLSKGVLQYTYQETDEKFINELVSYPYFWTPTNENDFDLSNNEYISYMNIADTPYNIVEFSKDNTSIKKVMKCKEARQQIFYGAPGTGKSHTINEFTKNGKFPTIRTTFHPDSDYSSFIGAYKPVMVKSTVYGMQGEPIKIEKDGKKVDLQENRIAYKFVKQSFLKAYLAAWKKYAEGAEDGVQPQFLVIEEINRGNCAQIFGDLFQLLDRSTNGFSCYPIEADADLQAEIANAFSSEEEYKLTKELSIEGVVKDYVSNYGATLSEDVQTGRVLLLPNNLYIWATMNTSDQSLFPIDSAFKRRWDWKYMPIDTAKENWTIKVAGGEYSWTEFLDKINEEIFDVTKSEDKKLGFYFCRTQNNEIDAEKFVGKVIFYLYNDVFKDYGFDRNMFKGEEGKPIQFHEYFKTDGSINEQNVVKFLSNLELSPRAGENKENAEEL